MVKRFRDKTGLSNSYWNSIVQFGATYLGGLLNSPIWMIEFLKETGQLYKERYQDRLDTFLADFEATEHDFIDEQLQFFQNTLDDLEQANTYEFFVPETENFKEVREFASEIGFKRFFYSTKAKIEFLQDKNTSTTPSMVNNETGDKTNLKGIHKLKWKGSKADLGFLISELIEKGYIEAPTKGRGKINDSGLARAVIASFETDEPLKESYLRKACNPYAKAAYEGKVYEPPEGWEIPYSNN